MDEVHTGRNRKVGFLLIDHTGDLDDMLHRTHTHQPVRLPDSARASHLSLMACFRWSGLSRHPLSQVLIRFVMPNDLDTLVVEHGLDQFQS